MTQSLKKINDTNNLIENVTGAKPTLIRPPYGSTNDKVKKTSGMYNILWSIDTLDWKHRDKNKVADAITKNAFDGVKTYTGVNKIWTPRYI